MGLVGGVSLVVDALAELFDHGRREGVVGARGAMVDEPLRGRVGAEPDLHVASFAVSKGARTWVVGG